MTIRTSNHVLNSMLNYEHFQLVADNGLTILYVADEVLLIDCVLTFYNSLSFVPFPLSNAFIRQLFFFFTYSEVCSEKFIIDVLMICFGMTFRLHYFFSQLLFFVVKLIK